MEYYPTCLSCSCFDRDVCFVPVYDVAMLIMCLIINWPTGPNLSTQAWCEVNTKHI